MLWFLTKSKQKVKPRDAKSAMNCPDAETYLKQEHRWFVVVTIDKVSNNIAFIYKKIYITKLLSELGLSDGTPNKTYSQVSITKEEIINANITYYEKSDIYKNDDDKTLPVMYYLSTGKWFIWLKIDLTTRNVTLCKIP